MVLVGDLMESRLEWKILLELIYLVQNKLSENSAKLWKSCKMHER